MKKKIAVVTAGSEYGRSTAYYVVRSDDVLVQLFPERFDTLGLAANYLAGSLGGKTLNDAEMFRDEVNWDEPDHEWDGCHLCQWAMWIEIVYMTNSQLRELS